MALPLSSLKLSVSPVLLPPENFCTVRLAGLTRLLLPWVVFGLNDMGE